MTKTVDFLVIGSGIAGLSFALKAAKHGKVLIVTKSNEDETNTKYAQGGVAVVVDKKDDSFEKHIDDTLIAGDGLCDKSVVEIVVKEGPERVREIIDYGTNFDKTNEGFYDLAKEGGHSEYRVLHYKDITGFEIERSLLEQIHSNPNIEILTHYFAVDLITQHHLGVLVGKSTNDITCYGIYAFNNQTGNVEKILSKVTVMASGGAGHIYSITTNPTIATGDGVAMVYRAKGEYPSFLISEAVRGFGGILKRTNGEEFMHEYDERGSLAPRDITARAIDAEIKKSGEDFVYLDIRHRKKKDILAHFPNIYAKCLDIGIDMTKDMIPVAPACYMPVVNVLQPDYMVPTAQFEKNIIPDNIPDWDEKGVQLSNEDILVTHNIREMQKVMNDYVGIVRSDFRLERAMRRLGLLHEETEDFYKKTKLSVKLCELRNLIQVSFLVIKSAMMRKESRGLHSTTDYPFHADKIEDTVF
eukprot:gene10584-10654_t